ncbi:MAG: peptide-methionine (R)-S-oxide reductase MsrB [bacterium]
MHISLPLKSLLVALAVIGVSLYIIHTNNTSTTSPAQKDAPSCESEAIIKMPAFVPVTKASAYFSGGCFWSMESLFQKREGVVEALSGYAGGALKNPTYDDVVSETTGHRESVRVDYDSTKVSYRDLVRHFLRHIDPTDWGGQFYDRGESYTTVIWYVGEEQKQIAETAVSELTDAKIFAQPIVVRVLPFAGSFYPAEEYHQDYTIKKTTHYCAYRRASGRDAFLEKAWGEKEWVGEMNNEKLIIDNSKAMYTDQIKKLTANQYHITQEEGTEPAYSNEYWDNHAEGIYVDIVSGEVLFSSKDKYDSGTGWPSFTKPLVPANIQTKTDSSLFMSRTEVRSVHANSHLGHIFDDGPADKGGKRYCMNSASMRFVPVAELKKEGYEEYESQFKM